MVLSSKVAKAINKQINAELYSSYLYLAMAAHFEGANLLGCAHWMKVQSQEENGHAMRFYKYVFDRGGQVALDAIDAPKVTGKTALDLFMAAYEHELKVTALINDLLKLARAENDAATENMLQWFIAEQVEEEANTSLIVAKLKMVGDHIGGLMIIDGELGGRK